MRLVVSGLWFVVCGLWFVVCGLWFVVCGSGFRFEVDDFYLSFLLTSVLLAWGMVMGFAV